MRRLKVQNGTEKKSLLSERSCAEADVVGGAAKFEAGQKVNAKRKSLHCEQERMRQRLQEEGGLVQQGRRSCWAGRKS